ncbi:MAG: Rieske (2Fe-2S) protein [Actinobacteria bacterium]|nr:Rieske (2Fe-2S) protein [Actinomycetota bacterium]
MAAGVNGEAAAEFVAVAALEDVREGYVTMAEAEGLPIVLTRVESTVRAFDGTCTHADFTFETARLTRSCEIECPIHGARFSAVDGTVVKGPATEPLPELPCRVEGDAVLVAPFA